MTTSQPAHAHTPSLTLIVINKDEVNEVTAAMASVSNSRLLLPFDVHNFRFQRMLPPEWFFFAPSRKFRVPTMTHFCSDEILEVKNRVEAKTIHAKSCSLSRTHAFNIVSDFILFIPYSFIADAREHDGIVERHLFHSNCDHLSFQYSQIGRHSIYRNTFAPYMIGHGDRERGPQPN